MSGLQYTLDRLSNLIPPAPPTSGLALERLLAYAEMLGAQAALNGIPSGSGTTLDKTWGRFFNLPRIVGEIDATYLARLVAYQAALGPMTTQDMQARNLERALAIGATISGQTTRTATTGGTQTFGTTSYGASGMGLDYWGQIYGTVRAASESDAAYAVRIIKAIALPATGNASLGAALDTYFGVSGTVVTDVGRSSFNQFNNSLKANNALTCVGFDAPFLSAWGAIKVTFPYGALSQFSGVTYGSGPRVALVEAALVNKKAAGVRVAIISG